jgi:hypothetical protein
MFFTIGCPCLLSDEATLSEKQKRRHRLYQRLAVWAAHIVLFGALSTLGLAAYVWGMYATNTSADYWLLEVYN